MKYVITGGAGHISKPLTEQLLKAGHEVTVIGRNAENLKPLTDQGAKAAIGSIEDMDFLKSSFTGADAVYTMVPPTMSATDWKGYYAQMGKNYTEAIKAAGVKHVVNLSSFGAHLPDGAGPVSGSHRMENELNTLSDVSILHLRPASFYYNLLNYAGLAKHMGIIGSNYGGGSEKQVLVAPEDIAAVAAEALLGLNFSGHAVRYIASDERTSADIAAVLGKAINKPDLAWVAFSDEQALSGMRQAGLPEEFAKNIVEMGTAIRSGAMAEDYWKNRPQTLGTMKLEDFVPAFAAAYNAA